MTSVLRYRAEEDGSSGDIVPPKPHRLKPLGDEDGAAVGSSSGDGGAANSEGANATPSAPKAPDRPASGENGQSPKTRMVKATAAPGAQATGLPEATDSMSGASTAATSGAATPAVEEVAALADNLSAPKKANPNRVSMDVGATGYSANIQEEPKRTSPTGKIRSCAQSAGVGSARLEQRRSMVADMPTAVLLSGNAREICNFYYRQAEQRWLWMQMQCSASHLLQEDADAALQDGSHAQAVGKAVPAEAERRCSKLDVLKFLGDDEEPQQNVSEEKKVEDASEAGTVRRQSVYILHAEEVPEPVPLPPPKKVKNKGSKSKDVESVAASTATPESAADARLEALPKVPNPLKESITAKKVDMDQVRALFKELPDANLWIDAPLDYGPPMVPKPIVYAIGMNDPKLVDLIIELGADVASHYNGPAMYKGWVKPGISLMQSVHNRKGRFVGTMLADRLTEIELKLHAGVAAQHAKAGEQRQMSSEDDDEEDEKPAEEIQLVEESMEEGPVSLDGEPVRRKSVAVKITGGTAMRHTQGHPSDVFEISEHLGDGDRSSVWLGFHKETKAAVAIKTEQKSTAIEAWLWEEINLMRKVEHPNIAQLFETFESQEQIFMVMELCEGGRLLDKCTPEDCAMVLRSPKLMRQTTTAVDFLHGKGIAHRDIQLDNFLLHDDKPLSEATVKLIDFTTAKMFGPDQPPLKTKICTPGYVAKEILTRKEIPYTEKVDIWSLGVVFFMMLSGTPPFYGETAFDTLKKVKKGVFKFEPAERWAAVPEDAKQLITLMINPKVEDRLSSSAVLAHPFIANA